ncbi:MAG TPA: glycosyltransferase [Desulfonatronum sp.]|nr:glycosyltransferase [Desulfonatronum sp.]
MNVKKPFIQHKNKTILYILHDGGGGTVHTTNDLAAEVSAYYHCFILKFGLAHCNLFQVESQTSKLIGSYQFTSEWRVHHDLDHERTQFVSAIIKSIHPDIVHTRTFICSSTALLPIFKKNDICVINSFHDFHLICPNIQLVDYAGSFCGGDCNRNEAAGDPHQDCPVSKKWFKDMPPLRNQFQKIYAGRNQDHLRLSDAFIVTSLSTQAVIMANFPDLTNHAFHIIEHGRDFTTFNRHRRRSTPPSTNIVFFGALNKPKGLDLVDALLDADLDQHFTIHILGNPNTPYFDAMRAKGAVLHGSYTREKLPLLIDYINPFLALIPSIWPETFCHTLTESWALGIPVLGSDLGAVGERIRKHGGGWVLPPTDAYVWHEKILSILDGKADYQAQLEAISRMEFKTSAQMAQEYVHIYNTLLPCTDETATGAPSTITESPAVPSNINEPRNFFLEKAKYHINRKHWEIAEEILEKLFHETGHATPADAYWLLSIAYRRQNKIEKAVDIISKGMIEFPAHPSVIKEHKFLFDYLRNNACPARNVRSPSIINTNSVVIDQIPFIETHRTCAVMPCTNMKLGTRTASFLLQRASTFCTIIIVLDTKKIGFINIVNLIFQKTNSDYFIYLAQDSFPGKNWLANAVKLLDNTNKGLLAFNDGKWYGKLASFGMVRRSWINTIYRDAIFYDRYKAHSADNELSIIAKIQNQYIYDPDIPLFEVDYDKEIKPLGNFDDREIFIARCASGFDGLVDRSSVTPFAADYQIFL